MTQRAQANNARHPLLPGEQVTFELASPDNSTFYKNTYTVEALMSDAGGSGLVYKVSGPYPGEHEDDTLQTLIMKECYPLSLADKITFDKSGALLIDDANAKDIFEAYKDHHRRAFTWQKKVHAYLPNHTAAPYALVEANSTLYTLSVVASGKTYKESYRKSALDSASFTSAITQLIGAVEVLERYHACGYAYLDMKPDNVFALYKADGASLSAEAFFFDFDTMHEISELKKGSWQAPSCSRGFSPKEQRSASTSLRSDIGTASDIYSLGATLYWLVCGSAPDPDKDLKDLRSDYDNWEAKEGLELTRKEKSLITEIFTHTLQISPAKRLGMSKLIELLRLLANAAAVKLLDSFRISDEQVFGRSADLRQIETDLYAQGSHIARIHGTPGLGKSVLAKAYAKAKRESYDTIAWLTYSGSVSTTLQSLKIKDSHLYNHDPALRMDAIIAALQGADEKTLIILDNYEEDTSSKKSDEEKRCRRALFEGGHHLLITQREPAKEGRHLPITPLSKDDLTELFSYHRYANASNKPTPDPKETDFLRSIFLNTISSHTLVLVLSAKLLADKSNYSLEELNGELSENLTHAPKNELDHTKDDDPERATFTEHIKKLIALNNLSPAEQRLLPLLSMLPVQGFAKDAVASLCSTDDFDSTAFDNTIACLVKRGLVNKNYDDEGTCIISLHPLTSDVAAAELQEGEVLKGFLGRVEEYLNNSDKSFCFREKEKAALLGEAVLGRVKSGIIRAKLLVHTSKLYTSLGKYSSSSECGRKALKILKLALPENHPDIASAHSSMATSYVGLEVYSEALPHGLETLRIFRIARPEGHPDIAMAYSNVGVIYGGLGNNNKALEYVLEALRMLRLTLPENHPHIARAHDNLGLFHSNLSNYDKALEHGLEALRILRLTLPENHPHIAMVHGNLGFYHSKLSDYDKALEHGLEALRMLRLTLPENHPYFAMIYSNVGSSYYHLGKHGEALEHQLEAHGILNKFSPLSHPRITQSHAALAKTYEALGNEEQAAIHQAQAKMPLLSMLFDLDFQLKAHRGFEAAFPKNHPIIAKSHIALAETYESLCNKEQAAYHRAEAEKISK